jgi:beta-lactamase superfamily II metal-dependent hydrolase
MNLKKIATSLLAGLLAVTCILPLASCDKKPGGNTPGGDTVVGSGEVKVKVLKMGRALASVVRTEKATIVIDTGDEEHNQDIVTFLTEKGIDTVDAVILTNYSKKCIGGIPALLSSGITVKAVYGAGYEKDSSAYTLFENALTSFNLKLEKITAEKTITFGALSLTCYPAAKDYSTLDDENDEGNSMAVAVNFGDNSMLFTSRIAGERLKELTSQISGKDFDCIMAPNFGAYDDNLPAFLAAAKAEYGVIVASNNNPPADATVSAMIKAGIKEGNFVITRDGSVEISCDGKTFSMKQ